MSNISSNLLFYRDGAQPINLADMSYSDIVQLADQNSRKKLEKEKKMMKEKKVTADGHEVNVGINHLGHFLLTNLLIDHLRKSESSR